MRSTSHEDTITIAKGMAIALVVIGHILARGQSEGNAWFTSLTQIIYLFHMPFFMFLSGLVFFKPGRVERLYANYSQHARQLVFRLLVPFVGLGVLVICAKFALSGILHVDNMPHNPLSGLMNLFWHTQHSPSQFIWYVFVLFIYSLAVPVLMQKLRLSIAGLLALAACIHFAPPIPYVYLDLLTYFLLFFVLGGMVRSHYARFQLFVQRYGAPFMALFIASLALYWLDLQPRYQKLLVGGASLPALYWLAMQLARADNKLFKTLGEYSYSIYLFNTLSIGLVKGIIFLFTDWHDWRFFLVAPVLLAAGILIPIALRTYILSRLPYLNRMTA